MIVKAATNKIGATRAHNLLSTMKGGYEYVHGMTNDFKNHQRDVNVFIGESDVQMLINKMENRKMYVSNFTFQYKVENSELVAMFWADEVAKCNYKEFGDIVSFDATFNSNKHNMKFVPFIGVDNHKKCVTLGSGMLLHEDTESYMWLLKTFITAFLKEPMMIVTDQDGAMKRAIEAVFTKAKHKLCMWHIMQKIPSKDDIFAFSKENNRRLLVEGCETVIVRDKAANACRTLNAENGKEQENETETVAETMIDYKGKNVTIERLTNEANFLLIKDEGKMGAFVEKLKVLKDEVKADVPNPPSRNIGDVIGGIFSISKPN
ncbi:regulation of nuclear pre-mRNA domain-containing protein 1B [Tanacetum coccineum]